jgi:putative ABC transport system permease protein
MWRHAFSIAFRQLVKQRRTTVINLLGLTVGIASCLLILVFVQEETSVDAFHANGKDIYRVVRIGALNGAKEPIPYLSPLYSPTLLHDYPSDIRQVVRVSPDNDLITYKEKSFNEKNVFLADSNFFTFFSFPLIKGDPATVLNDPLSVVMTASTAKRYFGEEGPIGKVVQFDKDLSLKVTGIAADPGTSSHLTFDLVVPLAHWRNADWMNQWPSNSLFTYAELNPNTNRKALEAKFPAFMDKYMGVYNRENGMKAELALRPLRDVYFDYALPFEQARHGSRKTVYIFSSIALLILLIACVNFVNLATARSADRAKEVGMRKVMGARSPQLAVQFLLESILLVGVATAIAVAAAYFLLPAYSRFLDHAVPAFQSAWWLYGFLLGFVVVVGILAGGYPALLLASFKPIESLKGKLRRGREGALFRRSLVVFQFAVSVGLMFCVGTVLRQMKYIQGTDLGFHKDRTLIVRLDNGDIWRNKQTFEQRLERQANVESVSLMSGEPGGFHDSYGFESPDRPGIKFKFNTEFADFNYARTLGLRVIAGRDLSGQFATDTMGSVLINRTAAVQMGFSPEQAVGKRVRCLAQDSVPRTIVGVVDDFHFSSLKDVIGPLVISPKPGDRRLALIRFRSSDLRAGVDQAGAIYASLAAAYPFEYSFLDDSLDRLYRAEARQETLLGVFSGIAILVACLGLFGLAAYTAVKRTKEVGVRKVLGSSVGRIVMLLSAELLSPVLVGTLIALPVGYYVMRQWLQGFAYRVGIPWWLLMAAAVAGLVIAMATVGAQAWKAARANPVKSLRTE